jgi:hypothetical protein
LKTACGFEYKVRQNRNGFAGYYVTKELKQRLNTAIHEAISRQRGAFNGGDIAASLKRADQLGFPN